MLTQESSLQDTFIDHLENLFLRRSSPASLKMLQEKAWDHFKELGLPSKKDGAYQYFPLRSFYAEEVVLQKNAEIPSFAKYEACKGSTIVFVDGNYAPELSDISQLPKNVVCLPLEEALSTYGGFLQTRFSKYFKEERDPFVFCNLAFHEKGLFFYVPPKTVIGQPVHCLHIQTKNSERAMLSPRVHLFIGALSEVSWINSIQNAEGKIWINPAMDISLEEGASLDLTDLPLIGSSSWMTASTRATVKKNAHFTATFFSCGSKAVRQSYFVSLLGEQANAAVQGLSLLKDNQQSHIHVTMEHVAPHTESMQLIKTAAAGISQASFEGKIVVRSEAQKTQAYQLNKNMMLGKHVICNSKPNLEIFADDVKASHGATFSQIDEEQLFYLQTRGIAPEEGKKLLLRGFCMEIVDKIPHEFIKKELSELV